MVDPDIVCSRTSPSQLSCGGCQSTTPPDIEEWLPYLVPDLSHPVNDKGEKVRWCGDPKVMVMLGMDNDVNPIIDAWILNVNTLSWEQVSWGRKSHWSFIVTSLSLSLSLSLSRNRCLFLLTCLVVFGTPCPLTIPHPLTLK